MIKYVFEILEEVGKQRTREEKVKILIENESWALKDVIRGTMDDKVQWNLPIGRPPYTPLHKAWFLRWLLITQKPNQLMTNQWLLQ